MSNIIDEALDALGATDPVVLNAGGQKSVVQAELAGERVAVKIVEITRGQETPEITMLRAEREFEALDGARNANLVGVRSALISLDDGNGGVQAVVWAEEYIDGSDLRHLQGSLWSWGDTQGMVVDVATGLQALHERNIVHRDLSPANVMRRASGGYVVLDPGFARFVDYTTITQAGQPGTPGHRSPEHYDAVEGPEMRSDIFQLGVLAFLSLTAELPFPAHDAGPLLAGQPQELTALRPDVRPDRRAIIERCISRRPARRYRTVEDLLAALEACA